MKKAKIIGIVVICILALIIILQNTASVETKLLFSTVTMSGALLLMVTFVLGFAAGLITSFLIRRPGKSKATK